jgi:hypothetical protein
MSHLIESMAFVGATPWHGLGNPLSPQQPLEVWLQACTNLGIGDPTTDFAAAYAAAKA